MYEYYWVFTAAQIHLADFDAPKVCYAARDEDKNGRGGLKPGDKGYRPDPKKLDDCVRKWKKRKAEREKRGFSLSKFFNTGELVENKKDS